MNQNPFTLMYGIPSLSIISRNNHLSTIVNNFNSTNLIYSYLITGIRGTGKTVLLREACNLLSKNEEWIHIDINPQSDIISSIASHLYDKLKSTKIIDGWTFSLNLPYISITKEKEKITDPEIIVKKLITSISKHNKKLLISIDEVTNTPSFKQFANFYQSIIAKNNKVYLLMTGLNENINAIINNKAMTFLSRIPKITLEPLDLPSIALEYKIIFNLENKDAIEMAKLTNGYAFAYQVLGYLFYEDENKIINDSFIEKYDSYLWNNGYNKFWNDLSKQEKAFMIALSESKLGTKDEIIKNEILNPSNYSQYRRILIEKGLIISKNYNELSFVLPRFKEFISFVKGFE